MWAEGKKKKKKKRKRSSGDVERRGRIKYSYI
jgi:hypothetical protein